LVSACLPESLSFERRIRSYPRNPRLESLESDPFDMRFARDFLLAEVSLSSPFKKLLFIAEGYAALRFARPPVQRVRDLVFSAPPSASEQSSYWRVGVMVIFSLVTQLSFFLRLSFYNIVEQNISINPMQDYFVEVVLIMIISTLMFGVTLYLQYAGTTSP